jgi:eukaryotic-like serine/threonine-protein kinase
MQPSVGRSKRVRFAEYVFDLGTGDLWRDGTKVLLPYQSFQILRSLLEEPGALVSREALVKKLWASDVFVDFEGSLNKAIKRLREILCDSAEFPRFIETLPRRGYRFIARLEDVRNRASESASLIGTRVSHYRVVEAIGGGGMGVVYRAEDLKLGRQVAMKFLPEEVGDDPRALERFSREARAASSLDHPNICPIYEFEEHEGRPFIVMQLLVGQTLRDRLAVNDGELLPITELLDIVIQVCDGLQAAHEKGIVHRDIKPANIFLTSKGGCRILDFGLVKLVDSGDAEDEAAVLTETPSAGPLSAAGTLNLTRTGTAMGTAGYMSPEQVRGEKLDSRSDIFSLGLVLYEMATGQRAFDGETAAIVRDSILNRIPEAPRELNPELSPRLENIITKTLQKDPEQRYQSTAVLRSDLQLLRTETSTDRRRWSLWIAAGLVASLACVGFFWLRLTRHSPHLEVREQQITANPHGDRVTGAAISPDGKYLAYHDQTGLYLRAVNSGEVHPVTLPPALRNTIYGLQWFPGGDKLLAGVHGEDGDDVWVITLLGDEKAHMLYRHSFEPAISPDGTKVAFTNGEVGRSNRQVWVGDIAGYRPQKLADTENQESVVAPTWSPDGRWVAYGRSWKTAQGRWTSAIEVRAADGGPAKTLLSESTLPKSSTFIAGTDGEFTEAWTSDSRLVFSVKEGWATSIKYSLWQVRIDPRTVEAVDKPERLVQWSGFWPWNLTATADGKRLSLMKERSWMDVYVGELGPGGNTMKSTRRLTRDDRGNNLNSWTSDSQAVLFDSERNGKREIFRQALTATFAESFIVSDGDVSDLSLSPDGLWLLYQQSQAATNRDGMPNDSAWMMRRPAAGGQSEALFKMAWADDFFCSSRAHSSPPCILSRTEGNKLVFYSLDPFAGQRAAMGARLGEIEIVSPWWLRGWNVSPDGSQLAFVDRHKYGGRIEILSLADGVWRELAPMLKGETFYQVAWAANGQGFFVTSLAPGACSLFHISRAGEAQLLFRVEGNQNGRLQFPLASRDGKYLAFSSQTWDVNVWMIDVF